MAIETTKGGGVIITGEHIEWYRLVSLLLSLRLELCGIYPRGPKPSAIMKQEIGLDKKHPNRMVFMYANNAMYAKGIISERIWKSNIAYLNKQFRDKD